jgi:hypothetical protein
MNTKEQTQPWETFVGPTTQPQAIRDPSLTENERFSNSNHCGS